MSRTIMIPIDGSPIADSAFQWYVENLYKPGDFIIIVNVAEADPGFTMPGFFANAEAACKKVHEWQDGIDKLCGTYSEALRKHSMEGKILKLTGDKPGEAIVKAIQTEGANAVVMGTRGLGRVKRSLLGSVSDYVIRSITVPVTLVPKE